VGNLIPASRFNAVGKAAGGYYPSPTNATPIGQAPTNNYTFDEARLENLDQPPCDWITRFPRAIRCTRR